MDVEILPFSSELAPHFGRLNRAWIEKLFKIEPQDLEELDHPERMIAAGGAIFFAKLGDAIVGTGALQRYDAQTFEVVKMGVDETIRGRGIGRKLLDALVAEAWAKGARLIRIETNSALGPANALYQKAGFCPAHEQRSFHGYARADAFWEMHRPRTI